MQEASDLQKYTYTFLKKMADIGEILVLDYLMKYVKDL